MNLTPEQIALAASQTPVQTADIICTQFQLHTPHELLRDLIAVSIEAHVAAAEQRMDARASITRRLDDENAIMRAALAAIIEQDRCGPHVKQQCRDALEQVDAQTVTPCPNCGGRLVLVDGWVEYGDQQVDVQRLGCYTCGHYQDA